MTDITARLYNAIHMESARIAPQTSELIEAAKVAAEELKRLRTAIACASGGNNFRGQ